ncbi:ferredoxin [Micromonospora sp. DSM 115977]|uniref:Ferredoxin n=1 Tax=Micromonospora reichwaldensis TaxID=3075516 RepID=A0ABU2WQN0_9ACTN|nr:MULTISPECIES: ferredoxin [unclassified Micromonospora]KAB1129183.1 ferredoxin [Micromonospora sp. AMSO12t]MDT0528212.1 ferredoxin [Micromonospora sp. DSM 115977]WSG03977.1 ferredoxin [Micromonospora sp. NBC_01740]
MSATDEQWRVHVDPTRCIGSGICAGTAPRHFVLVDGLARPLAERVAPDDALVDAADSCPMEAVIVSEADGLRRIAPET